MATKKKPPGDLKPKGGARPGAGRPKAAKPLDEMFPLRVSANVLASYHALEQAQKKELLARLRAAIERHVLRANEAVTGRSDKGRR